MTYSETFLKRIETSNTKKQTLPDYELKNPIDAPLFVTGIVLIADSYFQLKGKCLVLVNGAVVFNEQDSESFKDINEIPIALTQKMLNRSNKIEVFAWNGVDSDIVALTVNLKLSENQDETFAGAKAVDRQVQKDAVSEFETIFALASRALGTYTELVDMRGYKKLIVMLSKPQFGNNIPSLVSSSFAPYTSLWHDGKLDTFGDCSLDGSNRSLILEYLTTAPRRIILNAAWNPNGTFKTVTVNLEISLDGVNWTNTVTYNSGDSSNNYNPFTLTCGLVNCKFVRVRGTSSMNPGGSSFRIYDVYDSDAVGGSGALSFEIKNSIGDWVEIIPAGEFGTITSSSLDVVKQVGDVTTISVSGKTYALPSTQDRFRIKYVISGGGLTNAVDIQRVA